MGASRSDTTSQNHNNHSDSLHEHQPRSATYTGKKYKYYKKMQPSKSTALFMLLLQLLLLQHCQVVTANETPEPAGSSLAKYVLAFSRPGAFKEIRAVFGDEPQITTACPPGDAGLECRQDEASRVYDDCPGGDCEACIGCNRTNLWPRCCQQNAMCCSNLARACQSCEPTDLHSFCAKHFKRCF